VATPAGIASPGETPQWAKRTRRLTDRPRKASTWSETSKYI